MTMKLDSRVWLVSATLAIAGLVGAGCGSNTSSPTGTRNGAGSIAVGLRAATSQESTILSTESTDATGNHNPGGPLGVPLESLTLTIDKIRIYPAEHDSSGIDNRFGGDSDMDGEHNGDMDGDSSSVPLDFAISPERVEVKALGDSLTVLLASLSIPEGKYTHLSVRISDAEGVLQGGQVVQVHVPRPDDMLMVQVPFTVSAGTVTPIVLVVDLSRSVHEAPPGSGNYILRPVLWGELGERGDQERWRGGEHPVMP